MQYYACHRCHTAYTCMSGAVVKCDEVQPEYQRKRHTQLIKFRSKAEEVPGYGRQMVCGKAFNNQYDQVKWGLPGDLLF